MEPPALGPDLATCAGLAHGRDYSNCRALKLILQKYFSLNGRKYLKTMAYSEGFQPSTPRLSHSWKAEKRWSQREVVPVSGGSMGPQSSLPITTAPLNSFGAF